VEALGGSVPAVTLVCKRGARGIVVEQDGHREELAAAAAAEVVDSTGAGDALAAGFLVGGPSRGLEAAARCVARLGAMPN
jgi:sugar/nucleoside kinase (ribokinase family)